MWRTLIEFIFWLACMHYYLWHLWCFPKLRLCLHLLLLLLMPLLVGHHHHWLFILSQGSSTEEVWRGLRGKDKQNAIEWLQTTWNWSMCSWEDRWKLPTAYLHLEDLGSGWYSWRTPFPWLCRRTVWGCKRKCRRYDIRRFEGVLMPNNTNILCLCGVNCRKVFS